MKKYLYLIAAGLVVVFSSCGNKFNIGEKLAQMLGEEDTTAVAEPVEAKAEVKGETDAEEDQWTEDAVVKRVKEIYARVNGELSKQEISFKALDDEFCSKDYKELFSKAVKAEEGRKFDDLCFIEYQPFDQGLRAPIQVSDIRPKLLTGDQAEVTFNLSEENSEEKYPLGFVLYLEDGKWMVHDFITDIENHTGIWDYMQKYVDTHK
jgi:hypothetical protein